MPHARQMASNGAVQAGDRLALPDGRALGWAQYGCLDGTPVLFFHGTPASRFQALPLDGAAARCGVRLIALERPGFGLSRPRANVGFCSWTGDVAAALDVLGIDRAGILAVSGGAAFALACASLLPESVTAVALVGGAGLGATGTGARLQRLALRRAPRLVERAMARQLDPTKVSEKSRAKALRKMSPADVELAAQPDVQVWMVEERHARTAHGVRPAIEEMRAYATDWGFDLSAVKAPVTLLHGGDDRNVPLPRVQALTDRLPDARLQVVAEAGHAVMLQAPEQVEQMLRELAKAGTS